MYAVERNFSRPDPPGVGEYVVIFVCDTQCSYSGTMRRFRRPDVSSIITSTLNVNPPSSDLHHGYVVDQAKYQESYTRRFRPLSKYWQTGTGQHPLRVLANHEGAQAMEKFRLSDLAQRARNKTDTALYTCDAHEHLGNMHRYNAAAAHCIFTDNNKKTVPFSHDLHCLHAQEATFFAERIITDAIAHRDPHVWLIFGRDSHVRVGIKDRSVMAAIEQVLQRRKLKWELGDARYKVILDNPSTSPPEEVNSTSRNKSRASNLNGPSSTIPSKTPPTPATA
ncbi:uncharacterized protein BT62DRAFT_604125 [Guyanagaster necrorhizus]|uniref:Uncharacterized protein n=1 Tax=Guyanagaster necrorhizus TaxID=856835 RepID=A0A9P7W0D7_9AGAR|nr:uncharacterized protein BT62DRAFT_604125 [Guyanagaster necrorhizus MCA 3950]KAG7449730.1 hypothetical protein BT62DRAFT_604125 [Guyanagaster necrorhizus MCA 3950]